MLFRSIDTLSAKQAGVDGQRARSQKCEGYTLSRREDGDLRVSSAGENVHVVFFNVARCLQLTDAGGFDV